MREIRNQLKKEGYNLKAVDGQRSLSLQLRNVIKAARPETSGPQPH
jgi:hypothetical protein